MSDPVSNAEVEDVLSSIRRLVSDDKRPAVPQADQIASSDRLVLTPALRVADTALDSAKPAATDAPDHGQSQDERAASDWLDEGSAAPVQDADDPAMDYDVDPYRFDDDGDESGEAPLRLLQPTFDRATPTANILADDTEIGEGAPQHVSENVEPGDRTRTEGLSAKIEALETAIGNIADNWEPDDPASAAPTMQWEDDPDTAPADTQLHNLPPERADDMVEPEAEAASFFSRHRSKPAPVERQEDAAPDVPEDDTFDMAAGDQVIDEETLRDLVSEIVREELQGALGERITRNVRKLVRREIHRALAAQELE